MSKKTDPAMFESQFKRNPGDSYYTEPWVTRVLLNELGKDLKGKAVWEPAAGRGDICKVLEEHGCTVYSSDIDPQHPHSFKADFIESRIVWTVWPDMAAIITNPPYFKKGGKSMAELFVMQALAYHPDDVPIVAMLMRSEFMHVPSRFKLFTRAAGFNLELLLPKRPRWDWWFRDKPIASPRHPYSWFIWNRNNYTTPTFKLGTM